MKKIKTRDKIYSITIVLLISVSIVQAETWIKDAANECAIWNPNPQEHETIIWCGNIEKGKAQGYGTAIWKVKGVKTEQAEGEWNAGRLHGVAVWKHVGGSEYAGQWIDGQKSGYGIYTWPDSSVFMGEYSHDQRKLGKLITADKKKTNIIQTSLARELSYKAQDASIQARKAATRARLENKKREPQIKLTNKVPDHSSKEAKTVAKQKAKLQETPEEKIEEEDPSAK